MPAVQAVPMFKASCQPLGSVMVPAARSMGADASPGAKIDFLKNKSAAAADAPAATIEVLQDKLRLAEALVAKIENLQVNSAGAETAGRMEEASGAKIENSKNNSAESPARRGRGAPKGNRNALKTGCHTAEMIAFRREIRLFLRRARMHREALKLWQRLEKSAAMLGKSRPPSVSPALRASEPPSPTRGEGEILTEAFRFPPCGRLRSSYGGRVCAHPPGEALAQPGGSCQP